MMVWYSGVAGGLKVYYNNWKMWDSMHQKPMPIDSIVLNLG